MIEQWTAAGEAKSVGLLGNAAEIVPELLRARRSAGYGDRPDLRARPTQRLPAAGLDAGASGETKNEITLSRSTGRRGPINQAARRGDGRVLERRCADGRLWQQHSPGRAGRGPGQCLRISRICAGLHSTAVLPRHRPVPVVRAVRGPGGHLRDRRQGQGVDSGQPPAPLARYGSRSDFLPGLAGADLLGRPGGAASPRTGVQRNGCQRAN